MHNNNGNLKLLATSSGSYGIAIKITVEPLTEYTLIYGVERKPLNEYVKIGNNPDYSNIKNYNDTISGDNVIKFRTPVNRTSIWVTFSGRNYYPNDTMFEFNDISIKKDVTVKWCSHNLLLNSQDFSSWPTSPNVAITSNTIIAPDGTTTAESAVFDGDANARVEQNITQTGSRVLAVWMKVPSGTQEVYIGFTSADLSLVTVTDQWVLYTYESDSGNQPRINCRDIATVHLWGAHVYRSDMGMAKNPDTNNSYVPTTSSPVYLPRVGHQVYDKFTGWKNEGLLHESEARTNVIFPSADFSHSNWIKHNIGQAVTGSYNGKKNPDGVDYAQYFTDYNHSGYLEFTTPHNLTPDHVRSIWVRSDTSEGTIGLLTDYRNAGSEVTVTPEWQRFDIKVPSTDVNSGSFIAVDFRIGNLDRVWIWGAQAELGDYVSSYIPTSDSQVTRAADVLTVPAANLPYSSTNMSMQMDGKITYADNGRFNEVVFTNWMSSSPNFIQDGIHTFSSKTGQLFSTQKSSDVDDTVFTGDTHFNPKSGLPFNIATRHGSTFINSAINGTALSANTTPTSLPDLSSTDLNLGSTFMGTIGRFRMWDEDLGDTGIAEASKPTPSDAFLMTVRVNAGETMVVPTHSNGTYDAEVDWGDGTTSYLDHHNDYQNLHTYAVAGDYQVSIKGKFTQLCFYYDYKHNYQHAKRVISIDNLGMTNIDRLWYAFYKCQNMVSFTAGNTNASPSDLSQCFMYCYAMVSCDVTGINTSGCGTFYNMFRYCQSLVSLDLRSFNVSSVYNLAYMLANCGSLETVDLSGWDTSYVTSMRRMFDSCSSLKSLDLSSFDTSKINNTAELFYYCGSLETVDLSGWDTSNVTSMKSMFYGCSSILSIDLSSFDTSSVTDMYAMFSQCRKLETVDLSGFDTSNVIKFNRMFHSCYKLKAADLSSFSSTGLNASFADMFVNCISLETVDMSNIDTSNVTNMSWMFYYCRYLTEIKGVENWNIQGLVNSNSLDIFLYYTTLDTVTYDQLLVNWEAQASSIPVALSPNFGDCEYTKDSTADLARSSLINNYGWSISDGGYA